MTTIPVALRELLERAADALDGRMCIQCDSDICCMADVRDSARELRALLSEQPQADTNSTQDNYEHFLAYSGLGDSPLLRYAYFHGADAECEQPQAGAGQTVPTICDDDSVLVPRGLIGAACYAIDKKADAPEVLKNLRSYRFVAAHQPPARHDQGDEVRTIQCLECGAPTRRLVTGLCDTHYVEFQEWRTHKHAAALTQSPKGEEDNAN